MGLFLASIVFGIIGFVFGGVLFSFGGSNGGGAFALMFGIAGFLAPSIITLDKIYEELKKRSLDGNLED